MTRTLSLFRSSLKHSRGTPLRVKNIVRYLGKNPDIELYTASWDAECADSLNHLFLDNNHRKDLSRLIRFIKEHKIEVVIGHTISSVYYALPLKYICGVKVILEMHGFIEEEEYLYGSIGYPMYLLKKAFFTSLYFFFDGITTSGRTATEFISRYNKNVGTMWCAVDTDLFSLLPDSNSGDRVVIGYAGNARVWQGLDFLLEAVGELHKADSRFILKILVSEKKYSLPEWASGFAELHPPVSHEDVPQFLSSCDVLIIPRLENRVNHISFPGKLTEYMATGKPVVASRTSDCHYVIKDGETGLLYDPGDKKGLISKLMMLENRDLRKKLGSEARKEVSELYAYEKQIEVLLSMIRDLAKSNTLTRV